MSVTNPCLKTRLRTPEQRHQEYIENREAAKLRNVKWRKENPEKHKLYSQRYNLKKRLGVTLEFKEELLVAQGYKCAICKDPVTISSCLDHDHTTNHIRGILCHSCNKMLGHAKDQIETLKAAAVYLEGSKCA